MFDLETMEKWIHLVDYVSSVDYEEYEIFQKEVRKLNESLMAPFDAAVAKGMGGKFPRFSEKDKEDIKYLYDKYILKDQERAYDVEKTEPVVEKSDPVIYWNEYDQFAEIISKMSKEEVDKLCEGRRPLAKPYIESIYTGEGNAIDILREIYFSEEDIADFQDLINSTIEKYRGKTEDKKIDESREGEVGMAEENKEVLTPEERISQMLSSEIEGTQIDVSPDVVTYFEEYVKNLTKEEYTKEAKSLSPQVIDTFYYIYTEKEWPKIIYPADARAVRDYMLAKYEERIEKLKDEITRKLGLSRDETDNKFRPDVTIEELEKANEKLETEDRAGVINELSKKGSADPQIEAETPLYKTVDEKSVPQEEKWASGEVVEYDFGLAGEIVEKKQKVQNGKTNAFQDPEVKAKILMSRIEGLTSVIGKISDDKWPEALRYLQGLANDNKENSSDTKEPIQETKQSFFARLKEKIEEGHKIATDKANARDEEIKRVATEYRKEFTEYVQANIDEVMGEEEGKVGIKQLEEQLIALKTEKAKNQEKLEALKKEKETLQERYKDLEIETGDIKQGALAKKKTVEKEANKLIKYEKPSKLKRLFRKICQKLGLVPPKDYSKEDISKILDGKLKVGEVESETKSAEKVDEVEKMRDEKIQAINEKIQGAEALLTMAKEEIADKEAEIQKMVDGIGDDAFSRVCQELKKLEADKAYLEKLKEIIANLSDRKAYRLAQRGIDR